jgi:predicted MPP superfamily phosphohydrolase
MKLIWTTDIHLDFVDPVKLDAFCCRITVLKPDVVLIGGDIAESMSLVNILLTLERQIKCPIYFVLGNHDYYHGSIADVREQVQKMTNSSSYLQYLTSTGVVKLTSNTCLIGHDSWSDGRSGDYSNSNVRLNDYTMIQDLKNLDKQARLKKLNQLGDEAASFFREQLDQALLNFQHILILTHVPPFPEACWHEGNLSNDDFLPHFCCKATGDVFVELMSKNPDKNLIILCGHTHSGGIAQILPNITVRTGGAVYGQPNIQDPVFVKE